MGNVVVCSENYKLFTTRKSWNWEIKTQSGMCNSQRKCHVRHIFVKHFKFSDYEPLKLVFNGTVMWNYLMKFWAQIFKSKKYYKDFNVCRTWWSRWELHKSILSFFCEQFSCKYLITLMLSWWGFYVLHCFLEDEIFGIF